MHLRSFQQLVLILEIVCVWDEMNTYYLIVFHDLNYYTSFEHKLHSHYIL